MELERWINKGYELLIEYGPKVIAAILIWIIGSWIARMLIKGIRKTMESRDFDISLRKFLLNLLSAAFKIVLIVVVLGTVGVETTSFVAILAAGGLALGLALQGTLANFAGGVLIMLIKPFQIGDWIKAQGIEGTVKEISIFNTRLTTFGNQSAIMPNGKLSNDNIINYTREGIRKESLTFGISYDSDIKLTKDILLKLVNEQPTVMHEEGKEPMIVVAELADSSVNLSLRYWAKNEDFWALRWTVLEDGKMRLEAEGIVIPFPQTDVHLFKEEN
ncbi:mechanosensitive ion channel [Subsaximicrobium wynnwilliamsii]|uniref:Mechanosensitive ion channel n=1 Tax=Subsaximicrobium wynnwilliamsii TaxID=291179 RepID=A0A5C6ZHI3_9FLAO|nr:mechanosensitive ion channel domain-containing protein [Subsaximicrobium wynnwilliamsii]TXD82468.1 mechanosensitive ion channel [Subsaximicrobium wynnwilliamsii]TXD88110.1 mechanosensitive ion channel [Subsaximicrobium wynnwilliamsii]TXE02028.1 mechanosensitive ion channel [Subsaximicrobium wynnwilliamsii]